MKGKLKVDFARGCLKFLHATSVCLGSPAHAQQPEELRDTLIADTVRACSREVAFMLRERDWYWKNKSDTQVVEDLLKQLADLFDISDVTTERRRIQTLLGFYGHKSYTTEGSNAALLLQTCAIEHRIAQESGSGPKLPPTLTRVYDPMETAANNPGGPGSDRLTGCLKIEIANPTRVNVRNLCNERISASWCIAEIDCPYFTTTMVLFPNGDRSFPGLRRGLKNTVFTWVCPQDRRGLIDFRNRVASCRP